MGIASIITTLVRGVGWTKVLEMVIEHGPDLFRKARERFQREEQEGADADEPQLSERISRLEKLLLEQESIIRRQAAHNELVEQRCNLLEIRLRTFKIITAVLALASLTILALLLKQM